MPRIAPIVRLRRFERLLRSGCDMPLVHLRGAFSCLRLIWGRARRPDRTNGAMCGMSLGDRHHSATCRPRTGTSPPCRLSPEGWHHSSARASADKAREKKSPGTQHVAATPGLCAKRAKEAYASVASAFSASTAGAPPPRTSIMECAAFLPAPMARMTVAAPVTMSPPAQTFGLDVRPFSSASM